MGKMQCGGEDQMDQNRNDQNKGPKKDGEKKKPNLLVALIISAAVILLISWLFNVVSSRSLTQKDFSHFWEAKESGNLAEVELRSDRIHYLLKEDADKPVAQQVNYYTGLPTGSDTLALAVELDAADVKVDRQIVEDNSGIMMILSYLLMFGLVFGAFSLLTKRMSGDGMMGSIGASKAKV